MPRSSVLDQNRIIGEIRADVTPREIALRYHVNRGTLHRLMNKFIQDVLDRQRSGRPRVTDARKDRTMLTEIRRNPYRTAAEKARVTIGNHGRQISDRTVRRSLQANGLFSRRPLGKPFFIAHLLRFQRQ